MKGFGFAQEHWFQRLTTPRCFIFGPAVGLAVPTGLLLQALLGTQLETTAQTFFAASAEHGDVQDFEGGPQGQIGALAMAC